jgi:hypothetical protein
LTYADVGDEEEVDTRDVSSDNDGVRDGKVDPTALVRNGDARGAQGRARHA